MPQNYQDEVILAKFEQALVQSALASSTVVNYLADLRAFLRWGKSEASGNFSLLKVTQGHIRLYRDYLVRQLNRTASTVNRHLMALRKFFTFARETGIVLEDPTRGVALVQDDGQVNSRPLSAGEAEQLLTAAQNGSRAGLVRRDIAILELLLATGLRVGEIVELHKDDVIFDHPGVHLRVSQGQERGQWRQLPLPARVCKALQDYLQVRPQTSIPFLFLSQEGRAISNRTVQRIIGDCARAAGLEGVSAQSLRRTFALHLFEQTRDLELVSRRLGHQSITITEQYLATHDYQPNKHHP